MRDITRAQAIELLKSLRFEDDETCSENLAVDMAIASLETDEAYDLMYEQPEFCKDCISREEALKALKESSEHHAENSREEQILLRDRNIIRGLPSVLPKIDKNDLGVNYLGVDCVSRSDVLKLMQDNWHTHNGDWAMQESMDDIRALPAVTPQEPRKGHWIEHPRTKELRFHHIYECSACKTQIIGNRYNVGNYKYCPHCGIEFEVEE